LAFDASAFPRQTELRLFAHIDALVRWREEKADGAMVAIDVPIGLPPTVGLRSCDREARGCLGSRWMCVFEPPDRQLFGADFEAARAIVHARRALDPLAHVLTQQGLRIMDKIAAVDGALEQDPSRSAWLLEVHPEVSFRRMSGHDLARKKSSSGKAQRRGLLRASFVDLDDRLDAVPWRRRDVGYDDMLDSYAALWSALRFVRGAHLELGGEERDERGLPMRMIV
jgi:predicted RNase H-like nuclease